VQQAQPQNEKGLTALKDLDTQLKQAIESGNKAYQHTIDFERHQVFNTARTKNEK